MLQFWRQRDIPQTVPPSLQAAIDAVAAQSDQRSALVHAYQLLTDKYRGYRLKTATHFPDLFRDDIDWMWSQQGFLYCTHINYLMVIILIKSGHFDESDVRYRWTTTYYTTPHQYLQVRLDNAWVDVDVWGRPFLHGLGEHAHGILQLKQKA